MASNRAGSTCFLIFVLFFGLQMAGQKQPVKYWINFKDKAGVPFSISEPQNFLSTQSVNRRITHNISIDATDLPVSKNYIDEIEAVKNVTVLYASKWLNGVVIKLDSIDLAPAALADIYAKPFVKDYRQVQKLALDKDVEKFDSEMLFLEKSKSGALTSSNASTGYGLGNSADQIRQLNLECLHNRGYRGQGMTIAVLDAGFAFVDLSPLYDSIRARNGILGTRDFVSGGTNAYTGSTHGSMVFSTMAAIKPGLIMGTAPMANYWLLRTEAPGEYITEEYNWIRGAEFADSVGADILTTSLGYTQFDDASMNHVYADLNGRTAPMSIASTMAARKGMFVLNAAGNERSNSWKYIGVPADADSICTVGAVDSLRKDVPFSSIGPTSDGRIKPDLVAKGAGTWVSQSDEVCFPGNGTSFATPVLAGAVACYWQLHNKTNNIQLLRDLKTNASNANSPNNLIGWGLPNLCPSFPFDFSAFLDTRTNLINIVLTENTYESISIELYDMLGHKVQSKQVNSNDRTFLVEAANLSDMIYLIKVKSSQGTKTKKFAKGKL